MLLLLGWSVLVQPGLWTLAALAALFVPVLLGLVGDLLRKPDPLGWRAQLQRRRGRQRSVSSRSRRSRWRRCPTRRCSALDAVVRTLWRLAVSRRGLLEWQPSAAAARRQPTTAAGDFAETYLRMAFAPALALASAVLLAFWRPEALPVALPVLLLWAASPAIVWWLNQPLALRRSTINEAQALYLRLLSRRTWLFFETFVGPQDNHLPPDNVQEQPVERIAHRTSPTNIGLSLLATLTARDFGYVTTGELIERTAATLDTMVRMERHRGHWLNWYDTQTLQPLRPAYVSSVDSGNLAGHLLTLRAALRLMADEPPHVPTAAARHGGHTAAAPAGASQRRRGDAARALRRTARRCTGRAAAARPQNCARQCRRWRSTPTTLLDALPRPAMAVDVPLQADRSTARGRALGARAEAPVRSRRHRGACTVHRARGVVGR